MHKEMLAVLAAVTEVIKANGGTETTTEYFGALVSRYCQSEICPEFLALYQMLIF